MLMFFDDPAVSKCDRLLCTPVSNLEINSRVWLSLPEATALISIFSDSYLFSITSIFEKRCS